MRVLVTGSRDFTSLETVRLALAEAVEGYEGPHTLIHGGARGADALAAIAAGHLGWAVETHPADWSAPCQRGCNHGPRARRDDGSTFCQAAGMHRNQRMVDSKPDLVVALYKRGSGNRGTANAVRLANKAGLDVKRVVA